MNTQRRITIEYVASGQPRPYADSRNIYRIKYEITNYKTGVFEPCKMENKDMVLRDAKHFGGWTEKDDPNFCWASTRLDYCTPVEGEVGVWEWKTTTPFTD